MKNMFIEVMVLLLLTGFMIHQKLKRRTFLKMNVAAAVLSYN